MVPTLRLLARGWMPVLQRFFLNNSSLRLNLCSLLPNHNTLPSNSRVSNSNILLQVIISSMPIQVINNPGYLQLPSVIILFHFLINSLAFLKVSINNLFGLNLLFLNLVPLDILHYNEVRPPILPPRILSSLMKIQKGASSVLCRRLSRNRGLRKPYPWPSRFALKPDTNLSLLTVSPLLQLLQLL